ncbi:MAG: response regulator [Alphaproteobacteria bacterium]|nr:response regulator [Alphaproteobacteria bacterium]
MRRHEGRLKASPRSRFQVLVVEDDPVIALDAEMCFLEAGADEVVLAGNMRQALACIDENAPSFALLDVMLGDEASFPIADKLSELDIPFVFASGYSDKCTFPEAHQDVVRLSKPYRAAAIANALRQ